MRSAIDRTFDLIEALAADPDGISLAEAARGARLSKSTAHRLLADMIVRGLVRQNGPNGEYSLTLEIALLAFRYLSNVGFLNLLQPDLDQLAAEVGELVRLSWLEGGRLAIVGESQGAKPGLRFDANLGRPVVLHTMAVGKVYLATMGHQEALETVRAQALLGKVEDGGPNAIQTEAELEVELTRVQKQGYAIAYDEADLGAAAVAVPILGKETKAFFGGLAIVVPTARWTPAGLADLVPLLHESAAKIARKAAASPFCRRSEGNVGRASGISGVRR
jgi:DNA-binding IclR family transcriptional regulator